MNFGERLRQARENCEMTQNQLAKRLKTTNTTISNWEKGVSKPYADMLSDLCGALGVDINWLMGFDFSKSTVLAPSEQTHIEKYRRLDEHGKRVVDLVTDEEAARVAKDKANVTVPEEPKPNVKTLRLYSTPAAAGYASPAFGEDYEDIEVSANQKGDFAVRIDGDSMDPLIKDGSIVYVSRQPDLSDGDVGLFFVDGNMLCKQYCADNFGNVYLLSLNRKRADADVTIKASSGITICCYGKVVLNRRPALPEA